MTKTVKTTVNQKIIPMKSTRNLFAHITLIIEKRQLDLNIWATGKQNIANGSMNLPSCRTH